MWTIIVYMKNIIIIILYVRNINLYMHNIILYKSGMSGRQFCERWLSKNEVSARPLWRTFVPVDHVAQVVCRLPFHFYPGSGSFATQLLLFPCQISGRIHRPQCVGSYLQSELRIQSVQLDHIHRRTWKVQQLESCLNRNTLWKNLNAVHWNTV